MNNKSSTLGLPPTRPTPSAPVPARPPGEQVFWRGVAVDWRRLAGSIADDGFSFEWHESEASGPVDWSKSFHPRSLEICLNLEGSGWVEAGAARAEFGPDTTGFFGTNGGPLTAARLPGHRHRFLSAEFSIGFLREHLRTPTRDLHPVVRRCIAADHTAAAVSGVAAINSRQRDLLRSLLHPPVLRAAQRLWYYSKALEFVAEFFFAAEEEPLCSRAQRLAQERVAKAKQVLTANLEETPSLEDLGRRVGCSPFYLSRTFSQETGLTISQWVREVRLERAAELLRSRACNVTEAALRVGYNSLSHFSQAFREKFGCCPGLYPLQTPTQRLPIPEGDKARNG
jgi:AraC-like DNA-binding protein